VVYVHANPNGPNEHIWSPFTPSSPKLFVQAGFEIGLVCSDTDNLAQLLYCHGMKIIHISTWTSTPCTLAINISYPSFSRFSFSLHRLDKARRCHCSHCFSHHTEQLRHMYLPLLTISCAPNCTALTILKILK